MALSTERHLANLGVTVEYARDFIFANLGNLEYILAIAEQFGVTNDMLAEIVGGGYTASDVYLYFSANGLDSGGLDDSLEPLIDQEYMDLAGLFALNTHTGILSTESLRAGVIANTGETAYWDTFDIGGVFGITDGTLTTEELGFAQLGALPATDETLESLYYGTLISTMSALDVGEAFEINDYLGDNEAALEADDPAAIAGLVDLLVAAFSDPATIAPLFDDSEIASTIVDVTTVLVTAIGSGGDASLFEGLLGFTGY